MVKDRSVFLCYSDLPARPSVQRRFRWPLVFYFDKRFGTSFLVTVNSKFKHCFGETFDLVIFLILFVSIWKLTGCSLISVLMFCFYWCSYQFTLTSVSIFLNLFRWNWPEFLINFVGLVLPDLSFFILL